MMHLALTLALRDSRRSVLQLVLMSLLIGLGTAALAAITLFERTLSTAVRQQSKVLLGADFVVSGRQPFARNDVPLPGEAVRAFAGEISFPSMAFFPGAGKSRLIQAVALAPGFPFYGEMITNPPGAAMTIAPGDALADRVLLQQSGAKIGDRVRLGEAEFRLAAAVEGIPGIPAVRELVAPRLYFRPEEAGKTGLLSYGSRARYKIYFQTPAGVDADDIAAKLEPLLAGRDLTLQTATGRRERVEGTINRVYLFLDLVSLASVVLAGLGVGGAVRLHLRDKRKSVALFRCLGATAALSSAIFLLQIALWAALSATLGAGLGALLQRRLFLTMAPLLPVPIAPHFSLLPLLLSILAAVFVAIVCSLPPLIALGRIPANAALREQALPEMRGTRAELLAFALLLSAGALYAMLKTQNPKLGAAAAAGVFAIAAIIMLTGALLRALLRRFLPQQAPYAIRQAGRNMYRPGNQTVLVLLGIGVTTYLIGLSIILEHSVVHNFTLEQNRGAADTVLFDVQPQQLADVERFLQSFSLRPMDTVPLVPMRLKTLAGKEVREARKDSGIPEWTLNREYRSTYRTQLGEAEEVIAGEFPGRTGPNGTPVSIEEKIARDLRLGLGSKFSVDIQGIEVNAYVASIRRVNWFRFSPNFFLVFPPGVLEEAPQTHIVLFAAEKKKTADFYGALAERFPNVSLIDLTLTKQTLEQVIEAAKTVVRVFALFVVAVSATILVASVFSTRLARLNEVLLFKILGARRRTVAAIAFFEYFFLALTGVLTGLLLAGATAWLVTTFYLKIPLVPALPALFLTSLGLLTATLLLSLAASGGVYQRSGGELLRS